jgi:hypothetical protein
MEPLRAWAAVHAIRLEDDHGSVTELFRQEGIAVSQSGHPDLTVYAGSRSARVRTFPRYSSGQAAILFVERETASPYLVIDRTGRVTTVTVETQLLDRLATDPLAQKIFLEAFQHTVVAAGAAPAQGASHD